VKSSAAVSCAPAALLTSRRALAAMDSRAALGAGPDGAELALQRPQDNSHCARNVSRWRFVIAKMMGAGLVAALGGAFLAAIVFVVMMISTRVRFGSGSMNKTTIHLPTPLSEQPARCRRFQPTADS